MVHPEKGTNFPCGQDALSQFQEMLPNMCFVKVTKNVLRSDIRHVQQLGIQPCEQECLLR